jgi:hypothetical protein
MQPKTKKWMTERVSVPSSNQSNVDRGGRRPLVNGGLGRPMRSMLTRAELWETQFAKDSKYRSVATDIEVELVKGK